MSPRHFLVDLVEGGIVEVGSRARVVSLEAVEFEAVRDALTGDEYFDDGTVTEWALEHAPSLEVALDVVERLRSVAGVDVEGLGRAVDAARPFPVESRVLERVREAAADELRRALVMLECIGSGDFDSEQARGWLVVLEAAPSGLHSALVEAGDALDVEVLVRSQLLEEHGNSLEEWAKGAGYRWDRVRSTWVDDEHDDVVDDLEIEFERAVSKWVDYNLGRGRFAPRAARVEGVRS